MKKLIIGLVILSMLIRIGFVRSGESNDEGQDNDSASRHILCDICEGAFTGFGDLCRSCVSVMEKVGKKWGYTR